MHLRITAIAATKPVDVHILFSFRKLNDSFQAQFLSSFVNPFHVNSCDIPSIFNVHRTVINSMWLQQLISI